MKVSIVIRALNEAEHIGKLLIGIREQDYEDVEVILVDSGSTDRTVEIATGYGAKVVKIAPKDFSFGRALNLGCEAAQGDVLVLASAHVYPLYQDWLTRLLEPFQDEKVALTYGRQSGNENSRYSETQIFRSAFPAESNWSQSNTFCNNANAAVRKNLWQEIPYDEQLTGLEDLDWAKRAMDRGHKVAYVAEAEIVHVHNEKPSRILNRYRREAIALKRIYKEQRFSLFDMLRLWPHHVAHDFFCALREKIFLKKFGEILMFRSMQMWGTYAGFRQKDVVSKELKRKFYYPLNSADTGEQANPERQSRAINYAANSGKG